MLEILTLISRRCPINNPIFVVKWKEKKSRTSVKRMRFLSLSKTETRTVMFKSLYLVNGLEFVTDALMDSYINPDIYSLYRPLINYRIKKASS